MVFTVAVPADARLIINDRLTTSTGTLRKFESIGVQLDAAYAYRVRAEFFRNGKPVSEEKTISLTAGQSGTLEFGGTSGAKVAGAAMPAAR